MPWELGYFDGHKSADKVAICPIDDGGGSIAGEEYLGLYKRLEPVGDRGIIVPFAVKATTKSEAESLNSFVHGRGAFTRLTWS